MFDCGVVGNVVGVGDVYLYVGVVFVLCVDVIDYYVVLGDGVGVVVGVF